jgi:hypothetical protein
VLEVADLEDHLHVREQRDALVGGEREHPVVVHHGVHGLDPVGVEVAVEHDPLGLLVGDGRELAHDVGEEAVLPLAGGEGDEAVELLGLDGLGVQIDGLRRVLRIAHVARLLEGAPALGLAGAGGAHNEHAVTDLQKLLALDDLEAEFGLGVVAELDARLAHETLEFLVELALGVDAGEQVAEQAVEHDLVLLDDLGGVEVAKGAHEERVLGEVGLGALEASGDHEHGLDGAKAPVVVQLGGQERLEQVVQAVELGRQGLGRDEALRAKEGCRVSK